MNFLDFRTILFGSLLLQAGCAAVLWLLWRHNKGRYPGLGWWWTALAVQAAGTSLVVLQGRLHPFFSVLTGNALGMYGMVLFYEGLRRFGGLRGYPALNWGLLAVFTAVHAYFTLARPDFWARSLNFNLALAAFCLAALALLLAYPVPLRRYARPAAYAYGGFVAAGLARVAVAVREPGLDLFHNVPADAALFLLYPGLLILLVFGLFLMVNQRLLEDTRADYEGRLEAEKALAAAIRMTRLGAWSWDVCGGVVRLSEEARKAFGLPPGRLTVTMAEIAALMPPEEADKLRELGRDLLAGGKPQPIEHRVRAAGGWRWVHSDIMEVLREDGAVRTVRGYIQDVTERKRAEAAMVAAQKLDSLGTLAGGIAHDFNNLLTGITGNLSLLRRAVGEGAGAGELFAEAEAACFSARGLARQLLTFASGGEPVKSFVDLRTLVREAVSFSLRGTSVKAELAEKDGKFCVLGDKDQLFQVFQNLALNAAQAMSGGGRMKVSVKAGPVAAGNSYRLREGTYAEVSVADEGPGMTEAVLSRVFEPYFTTKGGGRGLGLAVCRSVLLKHGGNIAVSSEPGKGSEFTVWLPVIAEGCADAPPAPVPAGHAKGRLLVMDDEEVVYKALKRMLTALGYSVEVEVDGGKAVAAWEAARKEGRPFSAAILDLTVAGGMGGLEAARLLKSLDPGAKLIASSGYSEDPVMADHAAHGFDGVLTKPYSLDDLARTLSRTLP